MLIYSLGVLTVYRDESCGDEERQSALARLTEILVPDGNSFRLGIDEDLVAGFLDLWAQDQTPECEVLRPLIESKLHESFLRS
jgi:hypothetical protein